MEVSIKEYTNNGISLIANAVRVTGPFFEKVADDKLVRKMVKHDFGSALEHVCFTFELKDISVALSRELLEHRIAAHTAKSTRYVSQKDEMPTYVPKKIKGKIRKEVEEHNKKTHELYKKIEKKVDRESARYILPMGLKCTYVWSINCRSLLNFLRLRLCKNAAPEIRELAIKIKNIVSNIYPAIFDNVDCRGSQWEMCPESYNRSCHKYLTKKEVLRIIQKNR
jgi:thymidylate synthase (FAD)